MRLHPAPIPRHPVHIIKRQLLAPGNVADGKQRQVVDVLVGVVAHARKDAQVGVARVVDEARRARQELAVDFQRGAPEARVQGLRVGELVEGEEVDVLALGDGGGGAAAVGLGRGDDFAVVAVDELALFDGRLGVDSWGKSFSVFTSSTRIYDLKTHPIPYRGCGISAAVRFALAPPPGWDSSWSTSSRRGTRTAAPWS